jgi:hypothetical protein
MTYVAALSNHLLIALVGENCKTKTPRYYTSPVSLRRPTTTDGARSTTFSICAKQLIDAGEVIS